MVNQFPIYGDLGCSQYFAVGNVLSTYVILYLRGCVLRVIPKSNITKARSKCIFSLARYYKIQLSARKYYCKINDQTKRKVNLIKSLDVTSNWQEIYRTEELVNDNTGMQLEKSKIQTALSSK